eukprot:20895-Heterococcus_DN1.PRE.6
MVVQLIKVKGLGETEKDWMQQQHVELVEPSKITAQLLPKCGFAKDSSYKPFDLMIIDEGSQLTVAVASLAVQYVSTRGRLIVAEDHLQLPPIIKGVYPQHKYGDIKYNGSVLECLLRQISHEQRIRPFEVQMAVSGDSVNVAQPLCTKLLENNRMNHSLAHFTQFTYGADYISQNPALTLNINAALLHGIVLPNVHTPAQQDVLTNAVTNGAPMCVINIQVADNGAHGTSMTRDDMAAVEARIIRDLYTIFAAVSNQQDPIVFAKGIVVVTPNHVQRSKTIAGYYANSTQYTCGDM